MERGAANSKRGPNSQEGWEKKMSVTRGTGRRMGQRGAADPDIRCRELFNTGSPEIPTFSLGLVFHPESFFDGPGARQRHPEAENDDKRPH